MTIALPAEQVNYQRLVVAFTGVATAVVLHFRSVAPFFSTEILFVLCSLPALLQAGFTRDFLRFLGVAFILVGAACISVLINETSAIRVFQVVLCTGFFLTTYGVVQRFGVIFVNPFLKASLIFFVGYLAIYIAAYLGLADVDLVSYVRGKNVRLEGFLESPNYFGMTAYGVFLVSLVLNFRKEAGRLILSVSLLSVSLSLSRAVLLASAYLLLGFSLVSSLVRRRLVVLGSLGIILCLILVSLRPEIFDALWSRFSDQGGGAQDRLQVALGAVEAALSPEHFLFGYGFWEYAEFGFPQPPHNSYASIFVDLGFAGFLVLLAFGGLAVLLICNTSVGKSRAMFLTALSSLFVILFFNDFYIYRDWWVYFGIIVGLASWRKRSEETCP